MSRVRFLRALAGMWWVFLSVGVLIPLQPQYVRQALGEPSSAVGVTILVFAVAGVLARPFAGVYLRSRDPWPLMAWGTAAGAAALALTPVVPELWWMLLLRFAEGFAVGLFYTAAATSVVQGTPAARRGSALSYFSVPLFLGVAVGPVVGDRLIAALRLDASWVVAGAVLALAVPFCLTRSPARAGATDPAREGGRTVAVGSAHAGPPPLVRRDLWRTMAHPSAVWPALIMALVVSGWASFQAYVPLYGPQLGLPATGTVFLAYSIVVLTIRIGGARLFDSLPLVELVVLGTVANVAGLVVAWLWRDVLALYAASVLMAVAIGMGYTTLMRVALAGVPAHEEGAVVGAYSVAYDIGAGAGAALMGVVVTVTGSYTSAFAGGAVAGVLALSIALHRLWPIRSRYGVRQLTA